MAVTFKYRNHLSLSYAPGISVPGKDGLPGKKGTSGNSMYFVDFDLDNSYSIDLALQKIENNKILTNDSNLDINSRPYKANDILISNTGNVYKIVNSTNNELKTKNYKFDIKFLGKLHRSVENDSVKIVVYDITGLVVRDYNDRVKYFPARQRSCAPTNRCEPTNPNPSEYNPISSGSNKSNCYMYGTWIKPVLWAGTDMTTRETALEKRLMYSFILELNNTKEFVGHRAPGSSESVKFKFNKTLEFINPGIAAADASVSPAEVIFTSEFLMGLNSSGSHSKFKTIYLSDTFMDKFHPSNNNIQCTLNNDKNVWYKIGKNSFPGNVTAGEKSTTWYDFPFGGSNDIESFNDDTLVLNPGLGLGSEAYVNDNDELKTLCQKTLDDFTKDISYFAIEGEDGTTTISSDMFPKYAIGKSLTDITNTGENCSIEYAIESPYGIDNSPANYGFGTLLLTDKRKVKVDRFRAGDSAYFSSIAIDPDFDYANNGILSNDVSKEIFDFISDDKNTYKLVVKKVKNKTVTISDIAVEFNTTTFRNCYYRQFTKGGLFYKQDTNSVFYRALEN